MKEFLNKFKSRKFLTCIAGIVMGACMYFGLDMSTIDKVSGAVVAISSIITYIYTEGKIDAAAAGQIKDAVDKVENAVDAVEKIEE